MFLEKSTLVIDLHGPPCMCFTIDTIDTYVSIVYSIYGFTVCRLMQLCMITSIIMYMYKLTFHDCLDLSILSGSEINIGPA